MNPHDLYLLAIVHELEPASYTAISMRSQLPDYFLVPKLTKLRHRGFLQHSDSRYALSDGVKKALLTGDHLDCSR